MTTTAFNKYTPRSPILPKFTCMLRATGGNDELATINGRLAQVVKIVGDEVTPQVLKEQAISLPMLRW